jgi:hypothetical protein
MQRSKSVDDRIAKILPIFEADIRLNEGTFCFFALMKKSRMSPIVLFVTCVVSPRHASRLEFSQI